MYDLVDYIFIFKLGNAKYKFYLLKNEGFGKNNVFHLSGS